jgi:teichuronic acid biosynthesis glycosyltransferase TuaC
VHVLTFTNLYPNSVQPRHGIFVEHRVRQLAASGEADVRVVAPVPWVPASARRFAGSRAVLVDVRARDERHGIPIWHPRFVAIPRVTSWVNPVSMALAALPALRELRRAGADFDVIDAHFLYPDAAAAVLLGLWLGKPVIATARGTDVNVFPNFAVPRAWIRWVARHAAALATVSSALRDVLIDLGVPAERVTVLRNGVDLTLFAPRDREALRQRLGLTRRTLISVGHLLEDKGHQFVIEALQSLPEVQLLIAGDGPEKARFSELARACGVADRVTWLGTRSQAELAEFYCAADVTVLATRREGMANVLIESLACGTPVIATDVGGNAEVISSRDAGLLMRERSAAAIVEAYRALERDPLDRGKVRQHAAQFGWEPTTSGQLRLFREACAQRAPALSA